MDASGAINDEVWCAVAGALAVSVVAFCHRMDPFPVHSWAVVSWEATIEGTEVSGSQSQEGVPKNDHASSQARVRTSRAHRL